MSPFPGDSGLASVLAPTLAQGRVGATAAISGCHILVVDDIEWNRVLIGSLLEDAGYRHLHYAADGREALAKVATVPVDLMILDIMMPVMDGFEVCRRLRANPATAELPVLVQTALSGLQDRNRAFEAGTTDLINKPLERTELLARVRIHLENRVLIRSLQHFRERVEGEMATARALYEFLLPSSERLISLTAKTGLQAFSRLHHEEAGTGSLWNFLEFEEGYHAFYLLSVSGRGVAAILNACRLDTLIRDIAQPDVPPQDVLSQLQRRATELMGSGEPITFHYSLFDHTSGTLTHAWTSGPPPLLLSLSSPTTPEALGDGEGGVGTVMIGPGQGVLLRAFSRPQEETLPDPEGGGHAQVPPEPEQESGPASILDDWATLVPILLQESGTDLERALDGAVRRNEFVPSPGAIRSPSLACLLRRLP